MKEHMRNTFLLILNFKYVEQKTGSKKINEIF